MNNNSRVLFPYSYLSFYGHFGIFRPAIQHDAHRLTERSTAGQWPIGHRYPSFTACSYGFFAEGCRCAVAMCLHRVDSHCRGSLVDKHEPVAHRLVACQCAEIVQGVARHKVCRPTLLPGNDFTGIYRVFCRHPCLLGRSASTRQEGTYRQTCILIFLHAYFSVSFAKLVINSRTAKQTLHKLHLLTFQKVTLPAPAQKKKSGTQAITCAPDVVIERQLT